MSVNLRFFEFSHLPVDLQAVSLPFAQLAATIAARLGQTTEGQVALRKLLEAKDAAVRATLEERDNARPKTIEPKEK